MYNFDELPTEQLHKNIMSLQQAVELLNNGLFQGGACQVLDNALTYLITLRDKCSEEFFKRPDADDIDPSACQRNRERMQQIKAEEAAKQAGGLEGLIGDR